MSDRTREFCLRWNSYQENIVSVFHNLLRNETHVDCTLAAEGHYLKAHKVVLCAGSPYLESLLNQHMDKQPILIFKDIEFPHLKSMLEYMYNGEVNIKQTELNDFLKAAESLQIKGLSGSEDDNTPSSFISKTTSIQRIHSEPSSDIISVRNTVSDYVDHSDSLKRSNHEIDTQDTNQYIHPAAKKTKFEVIKVNSVSQLEHPLDHPIISSCSEPIITSALKSEVDPLTIHNDEVDQSILVLQSKDDYYDNMQQSVESLALEVEEEEVESQEDTSQVDNTEIEYTELQTVEAEVINTDNGPKVTCPYCLFECFMITDEFHYHTKDCKGVERPDKNHKFFCFLCSYHTNHGPNMKRHIQAKHVIEKPFRCLHCSYSSHEKKRLLLHIESLHKVTCVKVP